MPGLSCDVLVVGGGPAGLTTAIALRSRGANVLLADSQTPPIDKACGEGIMPDARRDLAHLGVELPSFHGSEFRGIRFCDRRSSASADFPSGNGLGVRRTVLHRVLVDCAAAAGVRLAWKTNVSVKPGQPLRINGEEVKYKYLVGADGQSSRVRSWAGLDDATLFTRRFGFRIHYRVAPWSPYVEVHWAAAGQAYVTPVADDEISISVMTRNTDARSQELIESIPELRHRLGGAKVITRERGAILTTRRLKSVARGNVALVGDASGSSDAITGEGLAVSFRQAQLLGDALAAENLSLYRKKHSSIMQLPQAMARTMLLMDRWPLLRERALHVLACDPGLFQSMLSIHIGERPLRPFILREAPGLGLRLLRPSLP
ncbi:flavin-dependent dehydrogenase [Silvibacterium bohemicum]|uniref:Flavin-dependent dehydrogenase n=1 Tax=Silvibacterium bohemicum TaxID=1577686 RepID=A0A841JLU4_9BACT|nr:NAD(P)/FAD-dependent oxidoreductase [Silvibacterium bohemicum]MBB6142326.1 flavin-dependent dehydrogenase [Silvibacterium bohemicum]